MRNIIPLLLFAALLLVNNKTFAQQSQPPDLLPVIENAPQEALCPETTITLSTQEYDSYQWYIRSHWGISQPIPGETNRELTITPPTLRYVRVKVTLDGYSAFSDEVMLDQKIFYPFIWAFGENVWQDGWGDIHGCADNFKVELYGMDSTYFFNFQWYNGLKPIEGANTNYYNVTGSGFYYYTASPYLCPNVVAFSYDAFRVYIYDPEPPTITQSGDSLLASWNLGQWYYEGEKIPGATSWILLPQNDGHYQFEYKKSGCYAISEPFLYTSSTSIPDVPSISFKLFPQPADTHLNIEADFHIEEFRIFNSFGRQVDSGYLNSGRIDISSLASGVYLLQINGSLTKKFVVTK
jgi:hypothetical protein